jgi:hypothetical protein
MARRFLLPRSAFAAAPDGTNWRDSKNHPASLHATHEIRPMSAVPPVVTKRRTFKNRCDGASCDMATLSTQNSLDSHLVRILFINIMIVRILTDVRPAKAIVESASLAATHLD